MAAMEFLDYYVKQTNERLDRIEDKLNEILKFKWQIIGGSALLSVIASIGVSIAYIYFGVR